MAPLDNGRWQGKVEQHLTDIDRRLEMISDWLGEVDKRAEEDRKQVAAEIATLKAKVGVGAFFGSIVGSIVVGVAIFLATRGFG